MWVDRILLFALVGSVFIWLKMPSILLHIRSRSRLVEEMNEVSKHPFICPNCGERFYVKWSHLHVVNGPKLTQLAVHGKLRMKCPHCNQIDWCRWMGKDEL